MEKANEEEDQRSRMKEEELRRMQKDEKNKEDVEIRRSRQIPGLSAILKSFFLESDSKCACIFISLYFVSFFSTPDINHELLSKLRRKKSPFLEMVSIRY